MFKFNKIFNIIYRRQQSFFFYFEFFYDIFSFFLLDFFPHPNIFLCARPVTLSSVLTDWHLLLSRVCFIGSTSVSECNLANVIHIVIILKKKPISWFIDTCNSTKRANSQTFSPYIWELWSPSLPPSTHTNLMTKCCAVFIIFPYLSFVLIFICTSAFYSVFAPFIFMYLISWLFLWRTGNGEGKAVILFLAFFFSFSFLHSTYFFNS